MEEYKDSEERTIESNEKELKAAIERAQDQIRRAQVCWNERMHASRLPCTCLDYSWLADVCACIDLRHTCVLLWHSR